MFDGTQITKQYTAPGKLNRVAAADAQYAWATTNDAPNTSEVYVFKDGTWSKDASALHMIIYDISAQDASHLWVTGVKDEDLPMAQKNPGRQTLQVMWVMSGGSYRPVGFPKVKGLGKVVDALKSGSVWAVVELTPYYGTKKFF